MPFIATLAELALERTCQDIVRHCRKWEAENDDETSNYWKFRMHFSEDVLRTIGSELEELYSTDVSQRYSSRHQSSLLDFVFNPYVRDIQVPYGGYSDTVMSTIARNCKNLQFLSVQSVDLSPDVYVPVFKNLKQLVRLNLNQCGSLDLRTIEVIGDSLIHLQVLILDETDITDEGIFRLCGHRKPDKPLIPSCCFSKECKAHAPRRLRYLSLQETSVSSLGIACILTHIPTITCISPDDCARFSIADVICQINMYRRMCKMVSLNFDLEKLSCPDNFQNWESLFSACGKIKCLQLNVTNGNACSDQAQDQGLVELNDLQAINVSYEHMSSIFNDNFRRFWRIRGKQLEKLGLSSTASSLAEYDPWILRKILAMCSGVEAITLADLVVRGSVDRFHGLEDFAYLGNLTFLRFEVLGDSEVVQAELFRMISAARNLRTLILDVPVEEQAIFDFIGQQQLPVLEEMFIKHDDGYVCYENNFVVTRS